MHRFDPRDQKYFQALVGQVLDDNLEQYEPSQRRQPAVEIFSESLRWQAWPPR
jgi:hypothetical protein